MGKHPHLSVVIPCYNEEKNIRKHILSGVEQYFSAQQYPFEIILVDDGSSDESVRLLEEFIKGKPHFRLIKNPHRGKAMSVISGVEHANGTYILFTDFDQATPIGQIEKLLPFAKQFDIVIGGRNTRRQGAPFSRKLMAQGFILIRNLILDMHGISDTQCGFKLFRKEVAKKLFKRLQLYRLQKEISGSSVTAGFDVELLFLAQKLGFTIKEVAVDWHYKDTRRVSPLRDSLEGFVDLVRIRITDLQGLYGT